MECAICGRVLTKLEAPNHPLGYVGSTCLKKHVGEAQVLEALEREGTEVELRPTIAYLRRLGFEVGTKQVGTTPQGEPVLALERVVITYPAAERMAALAKRERHYRDILVRHLNPRLPA